MIWCVWQVGKWPGRVGARGGGRTGCVFGRVKSIVSLANRENDGS